MKYIIPIYGFYPCFEERFCFEIINNSEITKEYNAFVKDVDAKINNETLLLNENDICIYTSYSKINFGNSIIFSCTNNIPNIFPLRVLKIEYNLEYTSLVCSDTLFIQKVNNYVPKERFPLCNYKEVFDGYTLLK